jgi:uncharacterized protein (TIGR00255 family)
MTGFGNAGIENERMVVFAEVKSLNSKYLDVNLKLPRNFPAEKELELRNLIKDKLQRGKISISLEVQYKGEASTNVRINSEVLKTHFHRLQAIALELSADQSDVFRLALQMPDVIAQDILQGEEQEADWAVVISTFEQALSKCEAFRQQEGAALTQNFIEYGQNIGQYLQKVIDQDPQRIETIKNRVQDRLAEIAQNEQFDKNRFEQEMIYYIEKLDITEEKVRLQNHLDYFTQTVYDKEANGRKLNFIAQEIGREINTIGSKANDAVIQRLVVDMKEELEKIKEQVSNIL